MRRLVPVLLLALCAAPLLAAPPPGARDPLQDPPPQPALERTLFYRLPAAERAGASALEVWIAVAGEPFTQERFALPRGTGALTVELLARHPRLVERLYGLAKAQPIAVTFLIDGRIARELAFADLVALDRRLRGRLSPTAVPSEVESFTAEPPASDRGGLERVAAAGELADAECVARCEDDYSTCEYDRCDGRSSCPWCGDWFRQCLESCPTTCVDPKSVRELTLTELVGVTAFDRQCYIDPLSSSYQWEYTLKRKTYKDTRVRRTEYCDGTYVDEVLSYSYFIITCGVEEITRCWHAQMVFPYPHC